MNGDLISIPVSYFSLFYHRNQIKEYQLTVILLNITITKFQKCDPIFWIMHCLENTVISLTMIPYKPSGCFICRMNVTMICCPDITTCSECTRTCRKKWIYCKCQMTKTTTTTTTTDWKKFKTNTFKSHLFTD